MATDGNAAALAHDKALDKLATEIIDLLRKRPRGLNVTAIRGEVDASPNRIQAALERLRMAGAATPTDGTRAREKVWQAINHGSPNVEN